MPFEIVETPFTNTSVLNIAAYFEKMICFEILDTAEDKYVQYW